MPDWADKAAEQLEGELERGEITRKEFNRFMSDLRDEYQAGEDEAAEQARRDYRGYN